MSLTNSQYDTIMRQYDAKQSRNREVLKEKMDKIYALDSRFAQIDAKIAETSVAQAKRLLFGDKDVMNQLRAQLADFKRQREVLLSDYGFTKADLEMDYSCPDCKDTGFVGDKKCHCFQQAAIDLLYTQSHIRQILNDENFGALNMNYYSKEMQHPYFQDMTVYEYAVFTATACKNYVSNFDKNYQNLLFQGSVGVGKTFLSHCIAKELIESGHSVIYFSAADLFDVFRKDTFDRDDEAGETTSHIYECDLLIIDDLGSEFHNNFTVAEFFTLLNERMMRKKPIIISTNLTEEQIEATYQPRIASRIINNFTMFNLYGEDIRKQKANNVFVGVNA